MLAIVDTRIQVTYVVSSKSVLVVAIVHGYFDRH
jgi:hypothetical protein